MATKDDLNSAISTAAVRFQILEQVIKIYLAICFHIIRDKIPGFCFKYYDRDIANLPLGRLTQMFRKYSPDIELHKKLAGLPQKRNYIAHNAYLVFSGYSNPDPGLVEAEFKKITAISEEASGAAEQVLLEIDRIHHQYPP